MDQTDFETRFSSIANQLSNAKYDYEFKTNKGVWSNIGTNRLDIIFTELSELYLEADGTQKKYIFDRAGSDGLPYNLWYFVRRVGKRIKTNGDGRWLEIGIAATLIDGGRGDFRDLIVSLISLHSDAEKHGIDLTPYFAKLVQNGDEKMKYILARAQLQVRGLGQAKQCLKASIDPRKSQV